MQVLQNTQSALAIALLGMMEATNLDFGGAGDGDHVGALREQPGERDLPRGRAVAIAYHLEPVGEFQQLREVLLRVPAR